MISYALLLLIGFFVGKGINSLCNKSRSRLIYYLLFGFLGLMVEWFLLGNAPVLEPLQIITQLGMFTYWGTMLLAPCLIMEPDLAALKKSFATFFASFSLSYLLVALVVSRSKGGSFLRLYLVCGRNECAELFLCEVLQDARTWRQYAAARTSRSISCVISLTSSFRRPVKCNRVCPNSCQYAIRSKVATVICMEGCSSFTATGDKRIVGRCATLAARAFEGLSMKRTTKQSSGMLARASYSPTAAGGSASQTPAENSLQSGYETGRPCLAIALRKSGSRGLLT